MLMELFGTQKTRRNLEAGSCCPEALIVMRNTSTSSSLKPSYYLYKPYNSSRVSQLQPLANAKHNPKSSEFAPSYSPVESPCARYIALSFELAALVESTLGEGAPGNW